MCHLECTGDRTDYSHRAFGVNGSLFEKGLNGRPVHKIHREELPAVALAARMNGYDVRMIQACHRAGFAGKTYQLKIPGIASRWEHFESNAAA